jgi:hypothetical protein
MRQFPYAQRTSSIHRGDTAQQQQHQQQQQSPPQRDTMSDMQEQFSKLAESTFRFLPDPESVPSENSILYPSSLVRDSPRCLNSALLTYFSQYCSWKTHVHLSRVEGESQSSRLRSAEVRRIFAPLRLLLSPSPSHLRGPRERAADGGGGTSRSRAHSFSHSPTCYRNTPNAASSGTGASIGTGYAVEPAAPGVDRHAQQAYYAPRVSPNPQPGPINDDFES